MADGGFPGALDRGPAVVIQLEPPLGSNLDGFLAAADGLGQKVDAFLIGDNPSAEVRLAAVSGALALKNNGHETIFAATCRDRNRLGLMADLLGAHALGLRNVLALSGDHPALGGHPGATPVFDVDSVQLLDMIHGMNRGVKQNGQPFEPATEFFVGAVVNPEIAHQDSQLLKFRLKAECGARFFFTQGLFHADAFLRFREAADGVEAKLLAGLRLIGEKEAADVVAGRRAGLNLDRDDLGQLASDPASALDLTLKRAADVAAKVKGRCDGFVVLAPGLLSELPAILERLDLW